MGLVYAPEKQVTVAELMSQKLQIEQQLMTKVRAGAMLHIEHDMAVLLKSEHIAV